MRCSVLLTTALLILLADSGFARNGMTCDCGNSPHETTICLTETQMSRQVKHIEMESDRMGNHVNVNGVAVFELTVGKDGRIVDATAISGHPLMLPLLIGAMNKWQFKPLERNQTARQVWGRLRVKILIIENLSKVEVVRP